MYECRYVNCKQASKYEERMNNAWCVRRWCVRCACIFVSREREFLLCDINLQQQSILAQGVGGATLVN